MNAMSCMIGMLVVSTVTCCAVAQEKPVYLDSAQPTEKRIDDLLARLTVEEKVGFCHANSIFAIAGVPRLGIPPLTMADGPMGVREETGDGFRILNRDDDFATAMPTPIALAATWDPAMAALCGQTIGQEALARGKHIMLAPAINMQRTPVGGRTFEYFGEDPYLSGVLAVHYVKAMQAQGVAACVKHFAVNNQETQRGTINVELDERTLREIYLPAFKMAVQEGGALAIMGAYNKVRGQYCCENDYLLNKVLKGEWGFAGLVISDWGGVHTTDGPVLGGLDIEMGTNPPYDRFHMANAFLEGVKAGKYPMSVLDDKVRRILRVMFTLNLIHDVAPATAVAPKGSLNTPEHHAASRRIAEASMVLIKNDQNLLPLDLTQIMTIAVIGQNAVQKFTHQGYGASVKASYEVTPLEGITKYVGERAKVASATGYAPPRGRSRGRGRGAAAPPAGADPQLLEAAVAAAKSSDVVIFVGGLGHTPNFDDEGSDKIDLKLPGGQDELIAALVNANPKTVVVMYAGSPVEMPWLGLAPAVLQAWYAGMESGNALARVLFGDVNPSGKLPCTFPKTLSDSPAHAMGNFPGSGGVVKYEEGLLIGYRWFDTKNVEPLLPFGYGLSYTTFAYSNMQIAAAKEGGFGFTVRVDVANTGPREGAEVVQLYLQDVESTLAVPAKELKAFSRVNLRPGEKQTVTMTVRQNALSHFDPARHGWVAEEGEFRILVGSSSRDIRQSSSLNLAQTLFNEKP